MVIPGRIKIDFLTGFTLIEVMIAVAIIAVALIILLHSVGIGIEISNQSKFISIAPLLAQEKMAEASGFGGLNNGSGDFGEEHPDISWETVVTNGPDANLKQVEVKISRGEGKWKSSFELVTYITKTDEK